MLKYSQYVKDQLDENLLNQCPAYLLKPNMHRVFFYFLGPSYCLINISSGIYVLRIFNGCYGTHPMSRCRRWNPTGALTRSGTRISTNSYRWVESKSRMDERRLRTSSTLSSFQLLDKFSSFLSFSLQRYESFSRSLDNLPSQRES